MGGGGGEDGEEDPGFAALHTARLHDSANRDKNGAANIGTNFTRLMDDQPPIRSMTDEDLAFHRASLCLECD